MISPRSSTPRADTAADMSSDGQVAGRYLAGGYTVIWAQGEIDMATAPDLTLELADAVGAEQRRVIVDLTHVTFMDSTGINALVRARRQAQVTNAEIRLIGASRMVRMLLRITALDQIFPIHPTIEESMAGPPVHHNGLAVVRPAHAHTQG